MSSRRLELHLAGGALRPREHRELKLQRLGAFVVQRQQHAAVRPERKIWVGSTVNVAADAAPPAALPTTMPR